MKKTFKYRIKASKDTLQKANLWLDLCHNLYNSALEEKIKVYKETGKSPSCNIQKKQLPTFKKVAPEYKQVNSQTLQDVLERLDKAFKAFFRRVKNKEKPGFPRFKGYWRYDSFTLKQTGWKMDEQYLTIKNIGKFKIIFHRPIEGTIKTITIRRSSSNKWFAYFSCNNVLIKPLPKTGNVLGIDVGLDSFLTSSNGSKVKNPRWLRRSLELIRKRQQRLSKRKKGSNRRKKARLLVAKTHERIRNQRRDFHFKTALQLLRDNDFIYIEKMTSWNSFCSLNRSMRDAACFGFFDILRFKAEETGREVIEVLTRGTSQVCSQCGAIVTKDLSCRIHLCPSCGLTIDRDYNAARNILRLGVGTTLRMPYTECREAPCKRWG